MSECRPICEVTSIYHLVETFIQYDLQLCEWIHIFSEQKKYSNWNESFHHWNDFAAIYVSKGFNTVKQIEMTLYSAMYSLPPFLFR